MKILKPNAPFICMIIYLVWVSIMPTIHAGRLGGTFLQLTYEHGRWEREKWCDLFDCFEELELSELIIQWTVYDETAFYPSEARPTVERPPLETILDLAGKVNMSVLVGLAHDPGFWDKIRRETPLLELYLRDLRRNAAAVARQLVPIVENYPAFEGWYLSEEIDDRNWLESSSRRVLIRHLAEESRQLKEILPGAMIGVSCFSSSFADPVVFRGFWQQILEKASLDLVFFQDGFGTGHQDPISLPLYLEALQKAVVVGKTDFRVVTELFEQKSQEKETFRAEPAPLMRIIRQLKLAESFSARPPIAFTVSDYMSPFAGEEAEKLYEGYLGYMGLKRETMK
jgi:hypothetical protein